MLLRLNLLLLDFVRILCVTSKDLGLISKHDATLEGCVQNVDRRAMETHIYICRQPVADCHTGAIVLDGYPVFDGDS